MKTLDQIVTRLKELHSPENSEDFFGFQSQVLMEFLQKDQLKEFIKPDKIDAVLKEWTPSELSEAKVKQEMSDYMVFAWGKVIGHRGLSAGRSVQKMIALLWLLEDQELIDFAKNDDNYPQYGAPILAKICEKYGLDIPTEYGVPNMIQGNPCKDGCEEGCGS